MGGTFRNCFDEPFASECVHCGTRVYSAKESIEHECLIAPYSELKISTPDDNEFETLWGVVMEEIADATATASDETTGDDQRPAAAGEEGNPR